MIEIYHNPRCSKSRAGVSFLEENGITFKKILYLKEGINPDQLRDLLNKLGMKPIELIRTNEKIWKEKFKYKKMSDAQIIDAMVQHPKLMKRPIIVNQNKAVVARPTEKINEVL